MEGGIHHDSLGVVGIQDKSRLHSVCTQVSGDGAHDVEAPWKLPGFSWNSLRFCESWRDLEGIGRRQVLSRAGEHRDRTCETGACGGRWRWREVGAVEGSGDPAWGDTLEDGDGVRWSRVKAVSPLSCGDGPSARTGGP